MIIYWLEIHWHFQMICTETVVFNPLEITAAASSLSQSTQRDKGNTFWAVLIHHRRSWLNGIPPPSPLLWNNLSEIRLANLSCLQYNLLWFCFPTMNVHHLKMKAEPKNVTYLELHAWTLKITSYTHFFYHSKSPRVDCQMFNYLTIFASILKWNKLKCHAPKTGLKENETGNDSRKQDIFAVPLYKHELEKPSQWAHSFLAGTLFFCNNILFTVQPCLVAQ